MERSGMRPHRLPQCPTEYWYKYHGNTQYIQGEAGVVTEPMKESIGINEGIDWYQWTTIPNAERNKGTREDEA
jgi:hypothetical protein